MASLPIPILHVLDLAGVAVCAISGALAAGRKRLDLIGVIVIAHVTAVGGGTIRDVLLGRTVFWIADPTYLAVIIAAALLTVLYTRFSRPPLNFLLVADALGLALFTVSGAQIAEAVTPSGLVIVMMGAVTGAAGGLVRDVLCNEIPLILTAGQLYASAALAGAAVYWGLSVVGAPSPAAIGLGMLTTAGLRIAAIFLGLKLPVYELPEDHGL